MSTQTEHQDRVQAIAELRQTVHSLIETEMKQLVDVGDRSLEIICQLERFFRVMESVVEHLQHCEKIYAILDDYDNILTDHELDRYHTELLVTLRKAISELNALDI